MNVMLQVPTGYRLPAAPIMLASTVVTGFGRGSRQLGVPTANLDPGPLQEQLQQLPQGVHFGWAQLEPPEGWAAADAEVHKMVMNVGRRPTVNTGEWAAAGAARGALH
jgi:riboflavin kinase